MQTILTCAVLLASAAAFAADDGRPVVSTGLDTTTARPRFSALGGRTIGTDANMLESGIGFPGLHAGFMHGVRSDIDLGGRFTVNGAYEGLAPAFATGFKGQGVMKLKLLDDRRVSLGLELAPGVLVYSYGVQTVLGVTMPVAVKMGIAASDVVAFAAVVETPYWISFSSLRLPGITLPAGFYVPLLTGGGIEFAALPNLLVTVDGRIGPTFVTASSLAIMTLQAKAGVAWRI